MSAKLKTGGDAKAMRETKFPVEFNKKVDMTKVNIAVMKKWISDEISRILQSDDDVVAEMVLENLKGKFPDIRKLQLHLTGFLDKDAPTFCLELWRLLISAQDDPNGIPRQLIEAKKLKLIEDRVEEDKQRAAQEVKREADREFERGLAQIRERERERRHGERGRGGRGGRYFDRRPSRDSRSPPRRRNGDDFHRAPARQADSYIPAGRGHRDYDSSFRRDYSPFGRSRSRSRSPRRSRSRDASPDGHRTGNAHRRDTYRRRSPEPRHRRSVSRTRDERYPSSNDRLNWGSTRGSSPPRNYEKSHRRRRRRGARSRSRSPPRSPLARRPDSSRDNPRDLMTSADRAKDTHRLERPGSSGVDSSRGVTPPSRRRSSSGIEHTTPIARAQTDEVAKD